MKAFKLYINTVYMLTFVATDLKEAVSITDRMTNQLGEKITLDHPESQVENTVLSKGTLIGLKETFFCVDHSEPVCTEQCAYCKELFKTNIKN